MTMSRSTVASYEGTKSAAFGTLSGPTAARSAPGAACWVARSLGVHVGGPADARERLRDDRPPTRGPRTLKSALRPSRGANAICARGSLLSGAEAWGACLLLGNKRWCTCGTNSPTTAPRPRALRGEHIACIAFARRLWTRWTNPCARTQSGRQLMIPDASKARQRPRNRSPGPRPPPLK